ncbi:hypothetical protein F5Y10DRAFT_101072 [Nemania abortiva]|nr:hypothetical protein F5Y10DRAFT_101072 [Nemania abortiva]
MVLISARFGRLLLIASLLATAEADGWDDFSNNLATDLAPLVALFGEQVTKQFLSESTTMLDNFIFAMAPLGIITAVVSVIRVCGGASLRAFIGRAQEGGGVVEAELCSSTSRDVCELYHNGAIVRVFGRPKILEIVHDRTIANSDGERASNCGIYSFQDYIKEGLGKKAGWEEQKHGRNIWNAVREKLVITNDEEAQEKQSQDTWGNHNQFAPNPNLSFNIGIREQPGYVLWLAAVAGFLIQAAVIVFGGLVTYTWRWTKNGALPPGWAFPLMSLGTLILDTGMFFCAFLIENSTEERVFRRGATEDRGDPTIYVVQPGNQIVGDQTFDAFSFTDASHRLTKYTTSWKVQKDTEIEVFLAIGTTLAGYVLQFVGLRAMHSSVSLFQLGTILLVSIIRAGLRTQRLAKEQNLLRSRPDEVEGHELDWLALQMAQDGPEKQPEEQAEDPGEKRKFWAVTGGPVKLQPPQNDRGCDTDVRSRRDDGLEAAKQLFSRRVFLYRSRLAELTSQSTRVKSKTSAAWDERLVRVRQQARQLKQAIESSANILFAQGTVNTNWKNETLIRWGIDVAEYDQPKLGEQLRLGKTSTVYLSLCRGKSSQQSTTWEVNQHDLEAVTGLWAWSIISDPRTEKVDEFSLQVSGASEVSASRILAIAATEDDIEHARRELKLWIEDFPPITSIDTWGTEIEPPKRHPGILWGTSINKPVDTSVNTPVRSLFASNSTSQEWLRLYGWQTAPDDEPPGNMFALTTTVSSSISTACAHDIYQSFLSTVTEALDSVGGETRFLRGNRGLLFTNEVVAHLVECFKESGLGSTHDAYSVIVPILRCRRKLSVSEDAIRLVHAGAEDSWKRGAFQDAEDLLKLAWQSALDLQNNELLAATMLEFGELYRSALFRKSQSPKDFVDNGISWMNEVAQGSRPLVDIAIRYADIEHRNRHHAAPKPDARRIIDAISKGDRTEAMWLISHVSEVFAPDAGDRTILSWAAQQGWPEMVKSALEIGDVIDDRDRSKRTALSYAAEHGHAEVVGILMKRGAQPLTEDSSRRAPLSYAAGGGHCRVMELLLGDLRVSSLAKDRDDRSPLHWAARNGHDSAIALLLQRGAKAIVDDPDHQGHSALIVALLNGQPATAEFLIENGARFEVSVGNTDAWKWAVQNGEWTCATFLLRLLNRTRKRKRVVVVTVEPTDLQLPECQSTSASEGIPPEIEVYAMGKDDTQMAITIETIRDVATNMYCVKAEVREQGDEGPKYDLLEMNLLPFQYRDGNQHWFTKMRSSPITNHSNRGINGSMTARILGLLLDLLGKEVKITEEVVLAAAGNCAEVVNMLLDRRGKEVKVTEEVVRAVATVRQRPRSIETAPGTWDWDWSDQKDLAYQERQKIMGLLLDGRAAMDTTEELIKAVIAEVDENLVKVLLDKGDEVKISEGIVRAAAGNRRGKAIIELFLDRRGNEIEITEQVIQAAVENQFARTQGNLSPSGAGRENQFTPDVGEGVRILRLLLDRRREEAQITEGVVRAAASNASYGGEIFKLLLDRKGEEMRITEDIVRAAARNMKCGRDIIELLLDRRGEEIRITEDIVIAATKGSGRTVELLLDRRGEEVRITDNIVLTAAKDAWHGRDIMELLLDRRGEEVRITEAVAVAAAEAGVGRTGRGTIELLLDRRGEEIKMTEDVVRAAAHMWDEGRGMKLLLDRKGKEVVVTEKLAREIVESRMWVDEKMVMLLDAGAQFEITEETKRMIADECGTVRVEAALDRLMKKDRVRRYKEAPVE